MLRLDDGVDLAPARIVSPARRVRSPAATACSNDPVCAPYVNCLTGCNGAASCEAQCLIDNPIGESSRVVAILTCLAVNVEDGTVTSVLLFPD